MLTTTGGGGGVEDLNFLLSFARAISNPRAKDKMLLSLVNTWQKYMMEKETPLNTQFEFQCVPSIVCIYYWNL